jgi:uncharacterized protein YbjT (DUF2867 family)
MIAGSILLSSATAPATSSSSAFDALVLSHLRRAHIKARLILNRVDFAGVSLRNGWVSGEDALGIIDEAGLLNFVVGRSS